MNAWTRSWRLKLPIKTVARGKRLNPSICKATTVFGQITPTEHAINQTNLRHHPAGESHRVEEQLSKCAEKSTDTRHEEERPGRVPSQVFLLGQFFAFSPGFLQTTRSFGSAPTQSGATRLGLICASSAWAFGLGHLVSGRNGRLVGFVGVM